MIDQPTQTTKLLDPPHQVGPCQAPPFAAPLQNRRHGRDRRRGRRRRRVTAAAATTIRLSTRKL